MGKDKYRKHRKHRNHHHHHHHHYHNIVVECLILDEWNEGDDMVENKRENTSRYNRFINERTTTLVVRKHVPPDEEAALPDTDANSSNYIGGGK